MHSRLLPRPFKPFLKWAGGKSQLLDQIAVHFPPELLNGKIRRYVEPFIGGGAIFFYIAGACDINEIYIQDINPELILLYKTIKADVDSLIDCLQAKETDYLHRDAPERKAYYYNSRTQFNIQSAIIDYTTFSSTWIQRSALLLFLNRTCFNGLFRLNTKGEFNVPFGRYQNPKICHEKTLKATSKILQNVDIRHADFEICDELVDRDTFVYFDPPYRPISPTSRFTAYAQRSFSDAEQLRLACLYARLHQKGAKLMLSNSDPKNEDPNDNFFEKAYAGFNVHRVQAFRNINSNSAKRGRVSELLITNY